MFERYREARRPFWKIVGSFGALSIGAHVAGVVGIMAAPMLVIRELPAPALPVTLFDAPPPPPPPPLLGAGGHAHPKPEEPKPPEPEKPPEPDKPLTEPDKPPEKPPDPTPPSTEAAAGDPHGDVHGDEHGVKGGEVGGSVNGIVGGSGPPKVLIKPQRYLSGENPHFPAEARTQHLSGLVATIICISATGEVTSVRVLKGLPLFQQVIKEAIMKWRYEPFTASGTAMPACFPVTFNFKLTE